MFFYKKILLSILVVIAANLAAMAASDDISFTHFDNRNGLSQNTVNCVIQDRVGFMWIGTKSGLNRFDGNEFRQFPNTEVHNAIINTLYEDEDGYIWIGSDRGIYIYRPNTDCISNFVIKLKSGDVVRNGIKQITRDSCGRIVIIVDNDAIYTYDKTTHILCRKMVVDKLHVGQFHKLCYSNDGQVWMSVYGKGLWVADSCYSHIHEFCDIHGTAVFDNTIISTIKAHGNKLYVGTERKGVYEIDPLTRVATKVFPIDPSEQTPYVREILFVDNNNMWIGTENGLYICNLALKKTWHYTHNPLDRFSLADNAIYSLTCDSDGGVWIGSYFGGLNYSSLSSMKFTNMYKGNSKYSSEFGERVRELCIDNYGKIWIGTEDEGISSYDPSTETFQHVVASKDFTNVHGLHIDGDDLWIGTFSSGLRILNVKTGSLRTYRTGDHGLRSDYIFSIERSVNGDIYLGTMSGLQRYDRASDKFITDPVLNDIFIYDLLEDCQGNLWVSTYVNGVYKRDGASGMWKHYLTDGKSDNSLLSNNTYGLYEDSKGTVWVMTQDGLCSYEPNGDCFDASFTKTYKINELVLQMVEDDFGKFWLTTNHGLYSVNPQTKAIHHYSTGDGLITSQFNYKSSLKTNDGTIYFGTIEGLVKFKPKAFHGETDLPTPTLVSMLVHGKELSPHSPDSPLKQSVFLTKTINLTHDQNTIVFKLATLKYSGATEQNLKYQLEGFDKEWQYCPVNDAQLRYSNLSPGSYVLRAAVFNDNPDECSPVTELAIEIAKPFYLTFWAFLFYTIVLGYLGYLALKYYRDKEKQKNERRLENIRQKEQSEAYDSKIKFFTNVAHEIRTPLTLIKAPLDCIFNSNIIKDKETRENLDVINLNVNRLLSLANQLLDFRRMENGKFQIHREHIDFVKVINDTIERFQPTIAAAGINFSVDIKVESLEGVSDRETITKIFSNLLTNAIKYSDKYINVSLDCVGHTMVLSVVNDGKPIEPDKREIIFNMFTRLESSQPGTGIGLSYARSLANMLDGTLAMGESLSENQFILRLPIDGEADQESDKQKIQNLEHILSRNEKSLTIMLVDDNQEMLAFLEKKLIAHNYRVVRAGNGVEALNLLQTEYVDLLISDVMMPEMDGYELTKAIKSDVKYSHIPVILLTAKTQMQDKLTGLEIGASAYIEKPFAIEYLLATINTISVNREHFRLRLEKNPVTKASGSTLSKVDEDFLRRLNEIIQANFENPDFSIDDVIYKMGVGRTTFYRKIKGLLDLSPYDYIRIERLKRAATLFGEGHTNVSEVCYMVGFSSPGYFSKCFQKQFGLTPKEYIAQNKPSKSGHSSPQG